MTALRDYAAAVTQPTLADEPFRYDELIDSRGSLRAGWRPLAADVLDLSEDDLRRAGRDMARYLADDGVTPAEPGVPWRLDPVPLLIEAAEWAPLEVGLAQRSELLNALMADIYGEQRLLSSGVIPPAVVHGHRGFLRVLARASARDEAPLLLAAADLGRTVSGEWQVIADHAQVPPGLGYAMENRRVTSRVLPGLYRDAGLHRMAPFFAALRSSLIQAAPEHATDPRVVVLAAGPQGRAAYDQAALATLLGVPLVEGDELVVRDGSVWMQVPGRLERVDVVLRRIDDADSDPLELRGDSEIGAAGLTEATRRGSVRVVNSLGAGVLENPGLLPFLSRACEELLDEPLRLPSVRTTWCGTSRGCAFVVDHLDHLEVLSIDGPGVAGLSRDQIRARIEAEPHRWVGRDRLPLSQSPTLGSAGVTPQPLVLRTFTLRHGSSFRPLVGGLALTDLGGRVPTSKDVWVLKAEASDPDQGLTDVLPDTRARTPSPFLPRALEDMHAIGRRATQAEDLLRLALTAMGVAGDFRTRPRSSGGACLAVLMRAIDGMTSPAEEADLDDDFTTLLLDTARDGSVAQARQALRNAALGVRDQLSPDFWRALGSADRAAMDHDLDEAAGEMLTAVLALHGVTASMMHDSGWHMIGAGRAVERALLLCRLLRATTTVRRGIDIDRDVLTAVLAAAESAVTHRRRYRGYVRVADVLDLLLLDVENPRSLVFVLHELRTHLAAMPASTGSTRPERLLDDLLDEVARADIATLVAISGETRPNLERFLDGVLTRIAGLTDAISALYFARAAAPRRYDLGLARTHGGGP